jgi:hypothetical protein
VADLDERWALVQAQFVVVGTAAAHVVDEWAVEDSNEDEEDDGEGVVDMACLVQVLGLDYVNLPHTPAPGR